MPEINLPMCNLCGLCANVCACGAIKLADGRIQINETEECHWCTYCEAVCPTGAITCPHDIVIKG